MQCVVNHLLSHCRRPPCRLRSPCRPAASPLVSGVAASAGSPTLWPSGLSSPVLKGRPMLPWPWSFWLALGQLSGWAPWPWGWAPWLPARAVPASGSPALAERRGLRGFVCQGRDRRADQCDRCRPFHRFVPFQAWLSPGCPRVASRKQGYVGRMGWWEARTEKAV
jgi:hypothetical protein